jgi:uncharacterized protein YbcI
LHTTKDSADNAQEPVTPDQASAVSRLMVQVMADYIGRGPEAVHTSVGRDVITVVLTNSLTKAERTLVEDGQQQLVLTTRRAFQRTMAEPLVNGVQEITGRQIKAFLSDHHVDPDVAVETFVLVPAGGEDTATPTPMTSLDDPRAPSQTDGGAA